MELSFTISVLFSPINNDFFFFSFNRRFVLSITIRRYNNAKVAMRTAVLFKHCNRYDPQFGEVLYMERFSESQDMYVPQCLWSLCVCLW